MRVTLLALLTACHTTPDEPVLELSPAAPTTDDDITASIGEVSDRFDVTWAWYENGALREDLTGPVLPADATSKQDTWRVVVRVADGDLWAGATAETVIENSAPLVTVALAPDAPVAEEAIEAVTETSDADGDPVFLTYTWTRDGQATSYTDAIVPEAVTREGETWAVTVSPSDPTLQGESATASVVVGNRPPIVTLVEFVREPLHTGELAELYVEAEDPDGDPITLSYAWTVDGAEAGTDATLSGDQFARGQEVAVSVIAHDAEAASEQVEAATIVENTTPELGEVVISPSEATETSTITCSWTGYWDADGDADRSTLTWERNGRVLTDAASLDGTNFDRDDELVCVVIPSDGDDDGAEVRSATLTIANTPPSITAVTLSDTSPAEGDTLSATVTGAEDADGDAVTYRYEWTADGVIVGTASTLASDAFGRGDSIVVTVTPTDDTDDGAPVTSAAATVVNSEPAIVSVAITPTTAMTNDTLTASVSTSDADGDAVSVTYAWSVDGVAAGTGATLAGAFEKGDVVTVTVTPDDGLATGTSATSAAVTIANSPPSVSSATLSPAAVHADTEVTCTPSGWADDDGDTAGYTYAWSRDGVATGITTATYSGDLARDEVLTCTVTPDDGDDTGTAVSVSTTVLNTPPSVTGVTLSATTATESTTLSATVTGDDDLDGDAVSYLYEWRVDGVAVSSASTLTGASFDKGDVVTLELTPTDGTDDGDPVTSGACTIVNAPPVVSAVSLSPAAVYHNDTVTAVVTASDPDPADTVTLSYSWTIDGVASGETGISIDGDTALEPGDLLAVVVTPRDSSGAGTAVSSTETTVGNHLPSAPEVAFDPDPPATGEDVFCSIVSESTDDDGDAVSYTFAWTLNGTAWTGAVATTDSYGDTIDAADTADGDLWECAATPTDGWGQGLAAEAATMVSDGTLSDLVVDGTTYTLSDGDYEYWDVQVINGGYLYIEGEVSITAYRFTVESGSYVYGKGNGNPASTGTGQGADSTWYTGGGAGYGGAGGKGGPSWAGGSGGSTYGDSSSFSIEMGSGGGERGGSGGGAGGAAVLVQAAYIDVAGLIYMAGDAGGFGGYGDGGGSGGGILLAGFDVDVSGILSASGGAGGGGTYTCHLSTCYGGGGGGGGRIKIFYDDAYSMTGSYYVSGGSGGTVDGSYDGDDGDDGTFNATTWTWTP